MLGGEQFGYFVIFESGDEHLGHVALRAIRLSPSGHSHARKKHIPVASPTAILIIFQFDILHEI